MEIAARIAGLLRPLSHYAPDSRWHCEGVRRALAQPVPRLDLILAFLTQHDLPCTEALRKQVYHRTLWRKWRLSWTTVSRWTKALGEQAAPDAPLGVATIAACDAVMGW